MTLFAQSSLGEHRSYSLSPALAVLPGDLLTTDGKHVYLIRGGVVIQTREITGAGVPVGATPVVNAETLSSVVFFRERRMPGQNVSMTGVSENATSGAVTLKFSSGNNTEYPSWEAVGEVADEIDAGPEIAEKILAMKAYRASPDGSNKSTQVGASVSVNGLADTPIVYTEPD